MAVRYPTESTLTPLGAHPPKVKVHGCTSCQGVMTEDGVHSENGRALTLFGIQDADGVYGVGACTQGNSPHAAASTALAHEDPIEITQKGLRQVQVHAKIDWTFATILRSFLRADPDVIMVGETRDPETAKTVIEASLTGHLVFSTMHTNSAVESAVRLLDLGLDPFNFADALLGVVGQRLTRKLCRACRQSYTATDEQIDMLAYEYCFETELQPADIKAEWHKQYGRDGNSPIFCKATGCEKCNHSGYKGRLGVHELLLNTAAIKKKYMRRQLSRRYCKPLSAKVCVP